MGWPMAVLTLSVTAASAAYWAIGLWPILPTPAEAAAYARGVLTSPHDFAGAWFFIAVIALAWFTPGRDDYPGAMRPGWMWLVGGLIWMLSLGALVLIAFAAMPNEPHLAYAATLMIAIGLGLQRLDYRQAWRLTALS